MTTFTTSRDLPAAVDRVFSSISNPTRLARWWGPAGFTNTFECCDFSTGGRWSFTMHGPDGKHYQNESVFAEITPPHTVVVQHISEPQFLLTIALAPSPTGTTVSWSQAFANDDVASRIAHIIVPSNEENLDRLAAEVMREDAGA